MEWQLPVKCAGISILVREGVLDKSRGDKVARKASTILGGLHRNKLPNLRDSWF